MPIVATSPSILTHSWSFDYFDIVANTFGSFIGLIIIGVLQAFLKINKQSH